MSNRFAEHPVDVLGAFEEWRSAEKCALVVMINTVGGAVRSKGALMVVTETGLSSGYISGGCIDSDVILQARNTIKSGQAKVIKYGAGSPYVDLPLPCGGSIELLFIPTPAPEVLSQIRETLLSRLPIRVTYLRRGEIRNNDRGFKDLAALSVTYQPKLQLRIAGRGADCLALARIARDSDMDVELQLTNDADIDDAKFAGIHKIQKLKSPQSLPPSNDDPWTAFVLAFHDVDWEGVLLQQALSGAAFYVGAVGSQRTQAKRHKMLQDMGVDDTALSRIHGPVGLVPALRDASRVAISTLAEIIKADCERRQNPFEDSAAIILAAGQSSRFLNGDKLTADLNGQSVLSHAAKIATRLPFKRCIAIVEDTENERSRILNSLGWETIPNEDSKSGMASSIRAGIGTLLDSRDIKNAFILLGDMPQISSQHLLNMYMRLHEGVPAVMSYGAGYTTPPALFDCNCFADLMNLSGDEGAKSLFTKLKNTLTIEAPEKETVDIDTPGDLDALRRHTV